MQKIRWFFLIGAILVALAMILQNNEATELQLFFFRRSMPLSVILLSSVAIGFLAGALTTVLMLRRSKALGKAKEKAAAGAEPKPSGVSAQRR
jgi:uncharacterized integral membrane protein